MKNKRVGKGVCIYPSGSKFEGQWVANKKEGTGRMDWPDGDSYEGEWCHLAPLCFLCAELVDPTFLHVHLNANPTLTLGRMIACTALVHLPRRTAGS